MTQPFPIAAPDLISVGAQTMVETSRRLGLTWELRPATVADPDIPTVLQDGDEVPTTAVSLIGHLVEDQRVMIMTIPPGGNYIMGVVEETTRLMLKVKQNDETLNNVATPQNDDELFHSVRAGYSYMSLTLLMWTGADTAADFRLDFSGTNVEAADGIVAQGTAATSTIGTIDTGFLTRVAVGSDHTRGTFAGNLLGLHVGTFWAASDATLNLRWSQANLTVSNLTLRAGSWWLLIPFNS